MNPDRIHRAVSPDGTEIAGPVTGDGPPLVLAHGGLDDGTISWETMLPRLREHYTCFVPSMRGRGLSADDPDQRPERHAEDLAAFIDRIGEPAAVLGYSTGGYYALGATRRGADVRALALFEAPVFACFEGDAEDLERFRDGVAGMAEAADRGDLTDAARRFMHGVSNDDEMAVMEPSGVFERYGRFVPHLLRVLEQADDTEVVDVNEPSQLAHVTVPTLLLYGTRTTTGHHESTRLLAERLPNARLHEIPDVGHGAPVLAPDAVTVALRSFLDAVLADGRRPVGRAAT